MDALTPARRITRALNRHARSPRSNQDAGLRVYFDNDGHEVYTAPGAAACRLGTELGDVCPWDYSYEFRAFSRCTWTIAGVKQEMEIRR